MVSAVSAVLSARELCYLRFNKSPVLCCVVFSIGHPLLPFNKSLGLLWDRPFQSFNGLFSFNRSLYFQQTKM